MPRRRRRSRSGEQRARPSPSRPPTRTSERDRRAGGSLPGEAFVHLDCGVPLKTRVTPHDDLQQQHVCCFRCRGHGAGSLGRGVPSPGTCEHASDALLSR
jgi:hypothetical protein